MERNLSQYASPRARPMLGQQKALDLKKARGLREIVWLAMRIGAAILVFLMLLFFFASFRGYLLRSPRFAIAIKEIQGLRHLGESQVLMKLKEAEEQERSLFALDLDALRKSVELLPWVKTATVRRVWPDRLMIQVTERVPIAFARIDDSTQLVDEDGVLLEQKGEGLPSFDFPVLLGLESGFENELLARNRKRIELYQRLMKELDESGAGLSRDVSEVHLQDPGSVSIVLNDDPVLVHIGADHFQERFRRYLAMSREIKQKYRLLESVDLRFQNQVVVNAANEKIASRSGN
ncbi:MAG: FtsQ-type POTRA domain-containing protein [Acidobacteria bacterium]|nr:FtsQ-type POTRA domain-containing protein [Acidobacteriota bacterium]MCI0621493.1 FtsQ-type POTRA domain-containing protein [Acidobacteriota bacterium]MCI0718838.1 FtsQ-type POTRA domain-containing protein [Acidobacteriota bacterium]